MSDITFLAASIRAKIEDLINAPSNIIIPETPNYNALPPDNIDDNAIREHVENVVEQLTAKLQPPDFCSTGLY